MKDDLDHLMHQVAEGNQDAFRQLVQTVSAKMYRLCLRLMGGQHALAEDALQEALIKLWVSAPRFEKKGSVEGYIATLIYNSCMDQHRRTRKTIEIADDVESYISADDHVVAHERSGLILNAIHLLPEKQQRAILLTYFEEQSNRTVAHMMQTSEKAVESLLVRARKTLATSLPKSLMEDLL